MFQNVPVDRNDLRLTVHPSVRRGTQFLSQVFAHCEQLGQVVPTEKSPRQIAAAPDEARALEQDAARRPAIERERAVLGLEPRIESVSPTNTAGNPSLVEQPEPESIYASDFARMAKIMEEILEGNKKIHVAQEQFPSHVDRVETETAQPYPASTVNGALPGRPLGNFSGGGMSDIKQPGLANSRWITPEPRGSTKLPPPPAVQRGQDMASGLNGPRSTQAAAQAPTMGQPLAAANGRARDRENSSLPAGQSWW